MKNSEKYAFLNTNKYLNTSHINEGIKKTLEYKMWYKGNINEILKYYKTSRDIMNGDTYSFTPSFMRVAPSGLFINIGGALQQNNFTVYHNSLANVISRAKTGLLFSTSPVIKINTSNKDRTKQYQEILDRIMEENEITSMLQLSAEYESYSGALAFKPILDPDFSDYPVIQAYPKEEIIVNRKYGKVISIVFKDNFEKEEETYTLYSEYGRGFVKYKLVKCADDRDVPLNTLEETQDLQDIYFFNKNGEQSNVLLAIYKENKPGARSDYENSIDDFNAIDEVYSNMLNFIRKTGPKRVVSQSELKKDEQGNDIITNPYDTDLIIKFDNTAGNQTPTNEIQTTPDTNGAIQGYLSAMGDILKNIARTVGLSIKTIMGEDPSGANASADALSIRENIDLKTRDNMKVDWTIALTKLAKLLMILNTQEIKSDGIYIDELEDLKILVEFYNPATPTFEQVVKEVRELLDAGLIDLKNALIRTWVDTKIKTIEEIEEMYTILQGQFVTEEEMLDKEIKENGLTEPKDEDIIEQEGEEDDE